MVTTHSTPLVVGVVQMRSSKKLEDNLGFLLTQIKEAAYRGASYVLTPENSLVMDLDANAVQTLCSSEAYNQALEQLKTLTKDLNIWLHIGGTPYYLCSNGSPNSQDACLANRSLLIAPTGEIKAHYDKIHMFDVSLPNGEIYKESRHYVPGAQAAIADCGFAKIGMSICYDVRFPGLYRHLAKAGADIITVPAAFTQITGQAHWHVLLRARAIETGCFIIASAQSGMHETGRRTFGHSLIVNPWGEVMLDAEEDLGVFISELDFTEIHSARSRLPSLQHDRPYDVEPLP